MKLYFPKHPEVKGVFVGGCIERGEGSSFRAKAHAHNSRKDKNFGWICVRSWRRIGTFTTYSTSSGFDGEINKPSMLLLHETAHILTPNHWHDDAFRAKVREIGGRIRNWEHKKKRIRHEWTSSRQGTDSDGTVWKDYTDERGAYMRRYDR